MLAKVKRNLKYISDQISASVRNCSPVTKALCLLVLIGHGISYNKTLFDGLTLTPLFLPKLFYNFYTLVTYAFVEQKAIMFFLDVVAIFVCGKLLEPLWGPLETVKFFALVTVSTGFYTSILYLLAYAASSNVSYLFDTRISGLAAFLAGLSVAIKQIMPDHVLLSLKARNLKLRNSHVPLLLFLTTVGLKYATGIFDFYEEHHGGTDHANQNNQRHHVTLWKPDDSVNVNASIFTSDTIKSHGTFGTKNVVMKPSPYPWMFGIGLVTSWIYLRFYQSHSNGTRGDMEDSFSFSSFFPRFIQPPIRFFSKICYDGLTKLHICKKMPSSASSRHYSRTHDSSNTASIILNIPGMDNYDAERRRLKALKALNERMNNRGGDTMKNIEAGGSSTDTTTLNYNQVAWPSLNITDDENEEVEENDPSILIDKQSTTYDESIPMMITRINKGGDDKSSTIIYSQSPPGLP